MNSLESPCVYIILLNWNRWEDTVECLDSLQRLDYQNVEVIIVDNASADDSVKRIKEHYPKQKILESKTNLGFAGGNNIGIRYALKREAEYVWLLNNDTVVDNKALTELVKRIEQNPSIGICGSKLIYYHQRDTIQALGGGSYNKWLGIPNNFGQFAPVNVKFDIKKIEKELDFILGASMLVSRDFLEDVGLLSEDYFLYYEEIDWGIRANGKYKLGFAPESKVFHKEGASIKATNLQIDNKSRLSDYYLIKNRFKITYKYYPYMLPLIYLTTIYSILNRIRRGQWKRIPMIIKLMFTFNK